jgi:hypothetical protein
MKEKDHSEGSGASDWEVEVETPAPGHKVCEDTSK